LALVQIRHGQKKLQVLGVPLGVSVLEVMPELGHQGIPPHGRPGIGVEAADENAIEFLDP
jgi:hypothetical protein